MNKQFVWAVSGHSESGDEYGPFLFAKKPSEDELRKFWQDLCMGGDYDPDEPGPGDYDTFVYTSCYELEVKDSI